MNDDRGWRNGAATPIASWLPTALTLVALCLAVRLVSWAPAATASTHVDLVARSNASTRTVPGDNFFPESMAAIPDGTLFVSSIVTGAILRNEGQVLRLFSGQPPNLPFKVQRLSTPTLPSGQSWSEVEVDAAIRLIGEEPDRDQHSRAAEAPNAGEAVVTRRLIRR
jgi:hypothetical protein